MSLHPVIFFFRTAVRRAPAVLALLLTTAALATTMALWHGSAASRPAALPSDPKVLKVAIDPDAMPLSNGERDYTSDGFEHTYARDLATQMGLAVELVPLRYDEQAEALKQGRVDASLRRRSAPTMDKDVQVVPTGYTSGLSVAMRSDTDVKSWPALAGHLVCATTGNARARAQVARVGARLQLHRSPAQALVAVRTGACTAAVLDQAPLRALLGRKEWRKFSATLPPTEPSALELVLPPGKAPLQAAVRAAAAAVGDEPHWARRRQTWASNVAFEVYFDQTGPDCH